MATWYAILTVACLMGFGTVMPGAYAEDTGLLTPAITDNAKSPEDEAPVLTGHTRFFELKQSDGTTDGIAGQDMGSWLGSQHPTLNGSLPETWLLGSDAENQDLLPLDHGWKALPNTLTGQVPDDPSMMSEKAAPAQP